MQITAFLRASNGALLSLAAFWLIDSLREGKVTPRPARRESIIPLRCV
jgi:hypothetical protein